MGFDPVTLGIGAAVAGGKYLAGRKKNKQNQKIMDAEKARTQGFTDEFRTDARARLGKAREKDEGVYNYLDAAYKKQAGGGDDISYNTRALPGYTDMARTGGWDPRDTADVEGNIGRWDEIARGEGSNSTFKEFSETGGYTDADKTNIRQRIAGQTPALYARLKENMANRGRISGGYGSGVDTASLALARGGAQENAAAVRDGEIGLSESVRAGRMSGAEGYSRNVLSALAAKNAARQGMVDSRTRGQSVGLSGMNDISQGEFGADASNRANRNAGIEGSMRLRQMGASGEESAAISQWMASLGMDAQQQERFLAQQLRQNEATGRTTQDLFKDLFGVADAAMRKKKGGDEYDDDAGGSWDIGGV